MKLKLITLLVVSSLVVSCASKKDVPVPREAKISYEVVEFSHAVKPKWIDKPSADVSKKDLKENRYFLSESEHASKRLCLKSAEVRATATVASEISQFIKNTYGESTQADEGVVEDYMQESLAQEVQAFVVGAQVEKTYWELRQYIQDLGAEKNYKKYVCYARVKMSKAALAKAIKNSTAKLYNSIKDPEVKENTQKILQDVAKKFNELE